MATFYNGKIVTDGLVLALDAGNIKSYPQTGTVWTDLSGNNNSGSLVNSPTFDGGNGGSIVFDGVDDDVSCGNPPLLSLPAEASISVWVRTNRAYPSDTSSTVFRGIVGKVIDGGIGRQSYYIDWYGTNSTRILRLGVGDSTNATQLTISNFNFQNKWTHIVGVWNQSTMQLWVNGILGNSGANSRTPQVITNPLRIGRVFATSWWSGNIAQVQLYTKTLTPQEILQNFNVTRARYGV